MMLRCKLAPWLLFKRGAFHSVLMSANWKYDYHRGNKGAFTAPIHSRSQHFTMEMTLSRLSHTLTGQTGERIHVMLFCQHDHLSAYKLGHDIFPLSLTRFLF